MERTGSNGAGSGKTARRVSAVRAARLFDARGVPWRGLDITASAAARQEFQRAGGCGTPLIFVDGQRVSGFQKVRPDRMLAQRGR